MDVTFRLYAPLTGKARHRFTKFGKPYTPTSTKNYEKAVAEAYLDAGGDFSIGAVGVDIVAYRAMPKSASKKARDLALRGDLFAMLKPDIDNIAKIVLDGLNDVAYLDDKQVLKLDLSKGFYAEESYIVVRVYSLDMIEMKGVYLNA